MGMNLSEFLCTAPADIIIIATFTFALLSTAVIGTINYVVMKIFFWDKDGWIRKDRTKALNYYVAFLVLFIMIYVSIIILMLR